MSTNIQEKRKRLDEIEQHHLTVKSELEKNFGATIPAAHTTPEAQTERRYGFEMGEEEPRSVGYMLAEIKDWCDDSDPCFEVTEQEIKFIGSELCSEIERLQSELLSARKGGPEEAANTCKKKAEHFDELAQQMGRVTFEHGMDALNKKAGAIQCEEAIRSLSTEQKGNTE